MAQGRRTPVSRWLTGGRRVLPRGLRWVLFAFGLVVLGGTYAATGSEGAQVLALFALSFGVYPAVNRRFGRPNGLTQEAWGRNPPLRVLVGTLVFFLVWGALFWILDPDLGLGPWFWWWVVVIPCIEVGAFLAERQLGRDAGAGWKPIRPARDSAVAGILTVPLVTGPLLLADFGPGEALVTGFLCGIIFFAIARTFLWMTERAEGLPR